MSLINTGKKSLDLDDNPIVERFCVTPTFHKYSIDHIDLFLSFILTGLTSLRGASRVFEIVSSFFQPGQPSPSWYNGRLWLLRIGYYKLFREKETADDWIWIIDHRQTCFTYGIKHKGASVLKRELEMTKVGKVSFRTRQKQAKKFNKPLWHI